MDSVAAGRILSGRFAPDRVVLKKIVRISGYRCLSDMEQEIRISYLCIKASNGTLSLEEECELLGYVALEPIVFQMMLGEDLLRKLISE